jgi:hypothetical protein
MGWQNIQSDLPSRDWVCGYCGNIVGNDRGFRSRNFFGVDDGSIYICPKCQGPTFFDECGNQMPFSKYGRKFEHLPEDISALYDDICSSISSGAYTASVLSSRKMLAHIAVQEGAPDNGCSFAQYVNYLDENHVVPRSAKGWVDHIRRKGNEATHEIILMSREDADTLAQFIGLILESVYEFPALLTSPSSQVGAECNRADNVVGIESRI